MFWQDLRNLWCNLLSLPLIKNISKNGGLNPTAPILWTSTSNLYFHMARRGTGELRLPSIKFGSCITMYFLDTALGILQMVEFCQDFCYFPSCWCSCHNLESVRAVGFRLNYWGGELEWNEAEVNGLFLEREVIPFVNLFVIPMVKIKSAAHLGVYKTHTEK